MLKKSRLDASPATPLHATLCRAAPRHAIPRHGTPRQHHAMPRHSVHCPMPPHAPAARKPAGSLRHPGRGHGPACSTRRGTARQCTMPSIRAAPRHAAPRRATPCGATPLPATPRSAAPDPVQEVLPSRDLDAPEISTAFLQRTGGAAARLHPHCVDACARVRARVRASFFETLSVCEGQAGTNCSPMFEGCRYF